jgi:transposase
MQLPMFPAGVSEINSRVAVETRDGQVCFVYGHMPVFQHEQTDVQSFRMFTSQMIVSGSVKPKEIVETFGVPMVSVKRYTKVYRQHGARGFYESKPRHSSASKLKGETLVGAQQLLNEGRSVPEVAQEIDVLANTIHKAIRSGRLTTPQKKPPAPQ